MKIQEQPLNFTAVNQGSAAVNQGITAVNQSFDIGDQAAAGMAA
jgi:hypothetical protein